MDNNRSNGAYTALKLGLAAIGAAACIYAGTQIGKVKDQAQVMETKGYISLCEIIDMQPGFECAYKAPKMNGEPRKTDKITKPAQSIESKVDDAKPAKEPEKKVLEKKEGPEPEPAYKIPSIFKEEERPEAEKSAKRPETAYDAGVQPEQKADTPQYQNQEMLKELLDLLTRQKEQS